MGEARKFKREIIRFVFLTKRLKYQQAVVFFEIKGVVLCPIESVENATSTQGEEVSIPHILLSYPSVCYIALHVVVTVMNL